MALADVNHDGKLDLITANQNSNNVSVLLGNGNGTFQAATTIGTGGTGPASVSVADVNGDGQPDIVAANYNSNTVSILLGTGTGSFALSGSPIATGGSGVKSAVVADMNGDGKPDIVATNYNSGTVTVLVGNGTGSFTQTTDSPVSVGSTPYNVVVADVNGDGRPDIITANRYNYSISVLLNDPAPTGTGFFAPWAASPFATGEHPYDVAIADLNGDGKPDLVTANYADNTVSVLLGNGSGGFTAGPALATGVEPFFVAVADVNNDGKPDIITANYGLGTGGNLNVFLGNGSGGFTATAASPFGDGGAGLVAVEVADVNGDGKLDLVVTNFNSSTPSASCSAMVVVASRSWVARNRFRRGKPPGHGIGRRQQRRQTGHRHR